MWEVKPRFGIEKICIAYKKLVTDVREGSYKINMDEDNC